MLAALSGNSRSDTTCRGIALLPQCRESERIVVGSFEHLNFGDFQVMFSCHYVFPDRPGFSGQLKIAINIYKVIIAVVKRQSNVKMVPKGGLLRMFPARD